MSTKQCERDASASEKPQWRVKSEVPAEPKIESVLDLDSGVTIRLNPDGNGAWWGSACAITNLPAMPLESARAAAMRSLVGKLEAAVEEIQAYMRAENKR